MNSTAPWYRQAVFYHLYPLGCFDAPRVNDGCSAPVERLAQLHRWLGPIRELGCNAVLLGPLFESTRHGYDTIDYRRVDRRLGTDRTLIDAVRAMREHGLRWILDAVFHHVGRDFPQFRDVRERGAASAWCDWFHLDHRRRSPYGDPFAYQGWHGHLDLVKLNLSNPEVRAHLFAAVDVWIDRFGVDGLRLDAADAIDKDFLRALAAHCRQRRPDFWLMGEVVHGDYRQWTDDGLLDSVTNYEAYKGLWSSHNDANYFEIAHSLQRQFGPQGIYRGRDLYLFSENHDVDRVASRLKDPAHLYPLHILLFGAPGRPSIYYGGELGWPGVRTPTDDGALRPALEPDLAARRAPHPDLRDAVSRLAALRKALPALQEGDFMNLHVAHRQYAFVRRYGSQAVIVLVNAAHAPERLRLSPAQLAEAGLTDVPRWTDALSPQRTFEPHRESGFLEIDVDACWGRMLVTPS